MDSINDGGHSSSDIMAASKINEGTDVNFGELTRKWLKILNNILMPMSNIIMK